MQSARPVQSRKVVRRDVVEERESTLDRRGFCQLLGACAAGLALAACTDGSDAVETGPLGGDQPDAAGGTHDAPVQGGDGGGSGSTCGTSPQDVGMPNAFNMNTATLFGTFFLVRDSRGLYAVSSQCTHRTGVTIGNIGSQEFRCPRHGATYKYDGTIISGPVTRGLVHYAICLLPNGHVGVSASQTVPTDVRLSA